MKPQGVEWRDIGERRGTCRRPWRRIGWTSGPSRLSRMLLLGEVTPQERGVRVTRERKVDDHVGVAVTMGEAARFSQEPSCVES